MEVGWYLRLSRAARIEALIRPGSLPPIEEQHLINPGWAMHSEPQNEYLRVVFTRESS